MAKSIDYVYSANGDTFDVLYTKVNTAIGVIRNNALTADVTSAGDSVTGNGFCNGIFGANTLVLTNLRAGNVNTPGSQINVQSNVVFSNANTALGNVHVGESFHVCVTQNTSTTTADQIILALPVANFRSGKFVIQAKNNLANSYQVTELLVVHDDGVAYLTEYATLQTNGSVATISANVSGTNLNVLYSPVPANTKVTIYGSVIKV